MSEAERHPADPPREPGKDEDRRERDIETDPAFSPVGPQGGAAISPLRKKKTRAPPSCGEGLGWG